MDKFILFFVALSAGCANVPGTASGQNSVVGDNKLTIAVCYEKVAVMLPPLIITSTSAAEKSEFPQAAVEKTDAFLDAFVAGLRSERVTVFSIVGCNEKGSGPDVTTMKIIFNVSGRILRDDSVSARLYIRMHTGKHRVVPYTSFFGSLGTDAIQNEARKSAGRVVSKLEEYGYGKQEEKSN